MSPAAAATPRYRETLHVPIRWWVILLSGLASVWLALLVSAPPVVVWPSTAFATAAGAGVLLGYGGARIEVDDDVLRAGRARLEWACCGEAIALDRQATRRLAGVDADHRAFLLLRPYIASAVRVDVADPADPTPYWMLSTRHPQRLADSINSVRVVAD